MKYEVARIVGLVALLSVLCAGSRVVGLETTKGSTVFQLNPFLDLSATYDSNPRFSTGQQLATTNVNKHSDVYEQVSIGAVADILRENLNIKLAGVTYNRTYGRSENNDATKSLSGGVALDATYGRRESLLLNGHVSYQRLYDYTQLPNAGKDVAGPAYSQNFLQAETWPERTQRDELRYGFGLSRDLTDKLTADVGYDYVDSKYDTFGVLSTWRQTVNGALGYRVTDKSTAGIGGSYGVEDSDGYASKGNFYTIGPTWVTRMTDKITLNASVGYEHYESGTLVGTDTKQEHDSLFLNLGGSWKPIEYWTISVQGSRGMQAGLIVSGTDESTLVGVTVSHDFTSKLVGSVGISRRWDRYDPDASTIDVALPIDSYSYSATVNYLLNRYLSFYFNLNYIDYHCNLTEFNNNEITLTLGGRLTF